MEPALARGVRRKRIPLSGPAASISFPAMTGSTATSTTPPTTPATPMTPNMPAPPPRLPEGVRVGVVAAAATIGAVVGLGLRHGLALRPFASVGRALLERLGISVSDGSATTAVGVAFVSVAIIVLGVCFTIVAAPLRGLRLVMTALLFATIAWVIAAYVVPSILVLSDTTVLGTAQRVFICVLLALSLVAGMRLARPNVRVE